MVKNVLIETWFIFAVFLWAIIGSGLWMLPKMMWSWFYLIPLFMLTTTNLIFALNIFLNNIKKQIN